MYKLKLSVDKDILKGLKISLGIVLGLFFFFGIVFAVGFHSANEIVGGIFQGNYTFNGDVIFNGSINVTENYIGSVATSTLIYVNDSSCPSGYSESSLVGVLINTGVVADGAGTIIGTINNRQSAVFDGVTSQPSTSGGYCDSGCSTYYVGKDWGVGNSKIISRFRTWGSSNYEYDVSGSNGCESYTMTMSLEGSNDNSIWVDLRADLVFTDLRCAIQEKDISDVIDTSTAYRYHRLQVSTSGTTQAL